MYTLRIIFENVDGESISVIRTFFDVKDAHKILGEVLYAVETQCHAFDTDDMYKQMVNEIPDKVTTKKSVYLYNDMVMDGQLMVKLSATKKK